MQPRLREIEQAKQHVISVAPTLMQHGIAYVLACFEGPADPYSDGTLRSAWFYSFEADRARLLDVDNCEDRPRCGAVSVEGLSSHTLSTMPDLDELYGRLNQLVPSVSEITDGASGVLLIDLKAQTFRVTEVYMARKFYGR